MRPIADAVFMPVPPMSTKCRAIPALSHAFVWRNASSASRKSRPSTHTIPVDNVPHQVDWTCDSLKPQDIQLTLS